jgi:aldehyde:ferredoxin oxidoreductase
MEAGLAPFGDVDWMVHALAEIRAGTEQGRLWAQGTARVGQAYGVQRVPVIKKQAISAYDPRVVEATGISMMVTAQGADHTVGNLPRLDTAKMGLDELMNASLLQQSRVAANDSLGLCMFGQTVTNFQAQFVADAANAAHGTELTADFFLELGRETLKLEREFNRQAGFGVEDDELPAFFYDQPLAPSNRVARFHAAEVHGIYDRLP